MRHYRVAIALSTIFIVIALCGCGTAQKLESARNSIANGEYTSALVTLESVAENDERNALIAECIRGIECDSKYREALSLVENYKYLEAAELFGEIPEYKDSSEQLKNAKYQYAFNELDCADLNKSRHRDEAFSILEELGTYNDSDRLLLEKKYQYAGDYCKKYRNGIDEVYKFYLEHLDYKDCLELYTDYVSESVFRIIEEKGNARNTKEELEALKAEIPEGYPSIDEAFTEATIAEIDNLIEQGKVEKASLMGEVIADSDYLGAKEKVEQAQKAKEEKEKIEKERITAEQTQKAKQEKKEQERANTEASEQQTRSQGESNGGGGSSNFNTYDNADQQKTTEEWVLNTNTMRIHYPSCNSVRKIAPQNYATSSSSLEELMSQGYKKCGNCFK